jgi:hypothetical protein
MPAGKDVRPKIWSDVIDLYDDGEYSAIWGSYNGNTQRSLGVRWNEGENPEIGYPSIFGHPQWYVEPPFTTQSVLSALFNKVLERSSSLVDIWLFRENIRKAQEEFAQQLVGNRLKRVIALYGAQATGKTPTLSKLILLLEKNIQGSELVATEPTPLDTADLLKDKKACFKWRGLTIGVATGGDNAYAIDEALSFFNKYNCDVGFVATRKRSDSTSCTELLQQTKRQDIQLIYVGREITPSKDPSVEDDVNAEQAQALLNLI